MINLNVENGHMPISNANSGIIENDTLNSRFDAVSGVVTVLPDVRPANANTCEQIGDELVFPVPDDAPPIPGYMNQINVDGNNHELTKQWIYKDVAGRILFYVQRFDLGEGRKEFRPLTLWRTSKGYQWKRKAPCEPRPVYNLHQLNIRPVADVLVCEGEKAAEAAGRLFPNMVVVTSLNGAKSPEKTDWTPLLGRAVSVWGDFDQAGSEYAQAVHRLAEAVGANVMCSINQEWFLKMGRSLGLEREDLPKGWDAADAEEDGFTVENIQNFLEQESNEFNKNTLFTSFPVKSIGSEEPINEGIADNPNPEVGESKLNSPKQRLITNYHFHKR